MIVAVAEFLDELDALERAGTFGRDAILLSPSPSVQATAKRRGVAVASTTRYLDRRAHERIVLAEHRLCQELDKVGGEVKDSLGVSQAYGDTCVFLNHHFLSYLMSLIEIVGGACDQLLPTEVRAVRSRRQFSNTGDGSRGAWTAAGVFRHERYAADVVARVCRARNIPSRLLESPVATGRPWRRPILTAVARLLAPVVLHRLRQRVRRLRASGQQILLFPSPTYRMREVVRGLVESRPRWSAVLLDEERGRRIGDLASLLAGRPPFDRAVTHAWFSLLRRQPVARDHVYRRSSSEFFGRIRDELESAGPRWTYGDVGLGDLVAERTSSYLERLLDDLHRGVVALNAVLEAIEPDVVVSQMALGPTAALGELARKKGIPALLVSHGSHVPAKNVYEEEVWRSHAKQLISANYEHVAVQTPWAERFLAQAPTHATIHRTGPVLLSRVAGVSSRAAELRRRFAPRGEKVVLHAGTPKGRASARMYVYETEDEYLANLRDLAEAIDAVSGYVLVVRFRPTPETSTGDLEALLTPSPRLFIETGGTFEDCLGSADLVASFSSTAIEEALLSGKPVLQYDPTGRYCHIPTGPFDPRDARPGAVYFVDRRDRLTAFFKWALAHHFPQEREDWFAPHRFSDAETSSLADVLAELAAARRSERADGAALRPLGQS